MTQPFVRARVCWADLRWSDLEEAWLPNGVEVQRPVYWDDVEVACVVYEADGRGTSFTAFFVPVEVTTTTTTLEWTYPTYTTFEIPPLPPVFIVSCNESLIPEPPLGYTWNCTKPGEGQECRAFCRGFPDQMTSVTCLKGQSSLEWFVTNECPVFTTTTLDMTVDKPADNAILNAMLVFVLIVIFFCSAGIFALMAYALYKFTMNEPSKSRISSKISPDAMHEVRALNTFWCVSVDQWIGFGSPEKTCEFNPGAGRRRTGRCGFRPCLYGLGKTLG